MRGVVEFTVHGINNGGTVLFGDGEAVPRDGQVIKQPIERSLRDKFPPPEGFVRG